MNPMSRAAFQGEAASSSDWDSTFRRIMALTASNPQRFASQPRANRFDAILEAAVPPRTDPTHTKVLALVNALVQNGAIRADEGGQMYNALLERVARYNSTNVQTNLDRLVGDVREAVALKERSTHAPSLASLVALNAFYETIPAHVPRGEEDYLAFLSALKLLVSEVPQTDVYQAGPHFFFSTSRSGSQTVNLSTAFDNLQPLWGVRAPVSDRSPVSSVLTPNTRLLLLIVAPFTESVGIDKDTYLGHLLTLYREAIGTTHLDEATYNEITSVSRALGQEDGQNLQATLNFLLTNRRKTIPKHYTLTADEERVLRYIQQSVGLYLMQEGATASSALDMTSANLSPSFYATHRPFINKLMDYLHRAAALSPNYFTNAILNASWLPPEGFFTGEFDFPEPDERLWEFPYSSLGSERAPSLAPSLAASAVPSLAPSPAPSLEWDDGPRSLSEFGAAAPKSLSLPSLPLNAPSLPPPQSGRTSADYLRETRKLFGPPTRKNSESELDGLLNQLSNWKTYAQAQDEFVNRLGKKGENADKSLSGTGAFSHLRPKGRLNW
nr:MAG: pIIIa protein [unidentified adenovirus]